MKTAFYFGPKVCLIVAVTVSATLAAHAAPSTNSPAATRGTDTNTIPKSVYNIPGSFAEGRDPFFPNRFAGPRPIAPVATNTSPNVELVLNGISQKLAIINGKTIAVGEETDVPTPRGRVQVRCIEVKAQENLVIVEVDGERKELKLRSGI